MALACTLLGAGFVFLVLLTWLGACCAPRRGGRHVAGAAAGLTWLWCVVGWVICGITYIIYLLVADACTALPIALASPTASGIATRVPCLDASFSANASSSARKPIFDVVASINTALVQCTQGGQGPTGEHYVCPPITAVTVQGATRYRTANATTACVQPNIVPLSGFGAAYTTDTCPFLATYQPNALPAMTAGAAAAQALVEVMPAVDALVSCAFITGTMRGANGKCPDLRIGARQLFGGLLLANICFTLLLCGGVWAYRNVYTGAGGAARASAAGVKEAPAEHFDADEFHVEQHGEAQAEEAAKMDVVVKADDAPDAAASAV
jgi:hypothetical protein